MSSRRAQPARKGTKVPPRKKVAGTPSWVMPASVVAGVAVLIVAFLIYRWYTTPLPPPPPSTDTTAQVISTITSLPPSELDAIGQGTANNLVKPVSGSALNGPSGKPEIFYYGAEYCPYCAAERWPIIIALSRFGTFSGLTTTTSSSTDVYPNTVTSRGTTLGIQLLEYHRRARCPGAVGRYTKQPDRPEPRSWPELQCGGQPAAVLLRLARWRILHHSERPTGPAAWF